MPDDIVRGQLVALHQDIHYSRKSSVQLPPGEMMLSDQADAYAGTVVTFSVSPHRLDRAPLLDKAVLVFFVFMAGFDVTVGDYIMITYAVPSPGFVPPVNLVCIAPCGVGAVDDDFVDVSHSFPFLIWLVFRASPIKNHTGQVQCGSEGRGVRKGKAYPLTPVPSIIAFFALFILTSFIAFFPFFVYAVFNLGPAYLLAQCLSISFLTLLVFSSSTGGRAIVDKYNANRKTAISDK